MGPLRLLLLTALFGLAMFLLNAWFATRIPWLGLTVETCCMRSGVSIKTVAPTGPAHGVLSPGTRLLALSDGRRSIPANKLWAIDYPYELTSYQNLNHFITQQEKFNALLNQPEVFVLLENGTHIKLGKYSTRPIIDLPLDFWLISLIGYGGFLISGGVWCFRQKSITARLFVLSGFGFFLLALSVANFSSRELTLDARILPYLLWGERIGDLLHAYSLCALLWYYPTRLGHIPIATVNFLLMGLLGVNDAVQFYEFPFHAFMLPDFLIPYMLCVILATLQWRRSLSNPVGRASLKWFLMSFFLGSSTVLILEYLPPAIGAPSIAPLWLEFAAIFIFYVGIALGISRYRLFDLDRWWLNMWLWLAGGIAIVILDILLTYLFALHASNALWLAAGIVGWVYFPLRQWLWKYVVRDSQPSFETYLRQLTIMFKYPVGSLELDSQWGQLLKQIFKPLHVSDFTAPLSFSQIQHNGLDLVVPGIDTPKAVLLTGRSSGQRLFNRDDQQLTDALLDLARLNLRLQQAYIENVKYERDRILRDLHDDVASPLMLLAHRAETQENRKLANTALMALREAVHGLQQTEASLLSHVLADWRVEVRERLEAANVLLDWEEEILAEIRVTFYQRTNIGRVLREAVSNALAHAQPRTVKISCAIQNDCLRLLITDDGLGGEPESWIKHTGLTSMQTRVTEIGGVITWQSGTNKGTTVEILIPILLLEDRTDECGNGIVNLRDKAYFSVDDAHQTQTDGFLRSLCTAANVELTVDGLDVTGDGIRRNPE